MDLDPRRFVVFGGSRRDRQNRPGVTHLNRGIPVPSKRPTQIRFDVRQNGQRESVLTYVKMATANPF